MVILIRLIFEIIRKGVEKLAKTYVSPDENWLQSNIMIIISQWGKRKRSPIPQKEIIQTLVAKGIKDFTVANALQALLKKGFIRKAHMISNKTYYVQLRTI